MADPERIHYGSDYPFTPNDARGRLLRQIEVTPLLDDTMRNRILREKARGLFPRIDGTAMRNMTGIRVVSHTPLDLAEETGEWSC
jgi:hypothetical protein